MDRILILVLCTLPAPVRCDATDEKNNDLRPLRLPEYFISEANVLQLKRMLINYDSKVFAEDVDSSSASVPSFRRIFTYVRHVVLNPTNWFRRNKKYPRDCECRRRKRFMLFSSHKLDEECLKKCAEKNSIDIDLVNQRLPSLFGVIGMANWKAQFRRIDDTDVNYADQKCTSCPSCQSTNQCKQNFQTLVNAELQKLIDDVTGIVNKDKGEEKMDAMITAPENKIEKAKTAAVGRFLGLVLVMYFFSQWTNPFIDCWIQDKKPSR